MSEMGQKFRESHLKRVYIVPGYSIARSLRVCVAAGVIAAE